MRCISQNGQAALRLAASNGHLNVVQHLCDVGGKELMMMQDKVSLHPVANKPSGGGVYMR
jgi:hypothetical protein